MILKETGSGVAFSFFFFFFFFFWGGGGGGGEGGMFHWVAWSPLSLSNYIYYNTSVLKRVVTSRGIYTAVDQVSQHDKRKLKGQD